MIWWVSSQIKRMQLRKWMNALPITHVDCAVIFCVDGSSFPPPPVGQLIEHRCGKLYLFMRRKLEEYRTLWFIESDNCCQLEKWSALSEGATTSASGWESTWATWSKHERRWVTLSCSLSNLNSLTTTQSHGKAKNSTCQSMSLDIRRSLAASTPTDSAASFGYSFTAAYMRITALLMHSTAFSALVRHRCTRLERAAKNAAAKKYFFIHTTHHCQCSSSLMSMSHHQQQTK